MRQSTSAALALAFALAPLAAGAQPPLGPEAQEYLFQGCDPYRCTTLDFFVSPASSYAQHPPRAAYAVGFSATHQFLDAGDGLGVLGGSASTRTTSSACRASITGTISSGWGLTAGTS